MPYTQIEANSKKTKTTTNERKQDEDKIKCSQNLA